MTCPGCGFENPASMKFCGGCGTALAAACASCGFENPAGFRFCGECGAELRGSGSRAQGSGGAEPRIPSPEPRSYTPKHLAAASLRAHSGATQDAPSLRAHSGATQSAIGRRAADPARSRGHGDCNVVYGLLVSGVACGLARRWRESIEYYEHALERIASTGAGAEWENVIDPNLAVALAEVGEHERALALARKSVERTRAAGLDLILADSGVLRARVLRTVGGPPEREELEAQIAETLALIEGRGLNGFLPLLLLERASLARLRGDTDGMARDLAAARRLFAEMGATGWDDYASSIEA